MQEENNMIETVGLNICSEEEINAWEDCIKSAIFSDLISLRELDKKTFSELYYGRTNETSEFQNALEIVCKTGRNYLVVGEAGVGKSTYLYKIFLNEDDELHKHIYPIFIDFRKGAITLNAALINFIDKIDNYFQTVQFPINTLEKPKENGTIEYNLLKISEHLSRYTPTEKHKPLLLLVDDLDYADDFWLEFLISIHNLIASPKMSFVLSVRPLLEFKIRTSNDVLYRELIRNPKRIDLGSLSVTNILNKRLAPIIRQNQENPFHHFIKHLFRRDSAICRILTKQYGIKNLEQLAKFEFPFTNKLMDFMAQVTNGNNREVFDIAEAVLRYIFKNANKLDTRVEEGETKYIITREVIVELFLTDRLKNESSYELFNLNEKINESGNSLHYNVLEAVKYLGILNADAYKILERLGHSKSDVDTSLSILEDRNNRLTVPLRTNEGVKGARNVVLETEYGITKKGEKYLEMIVIDDEWQCYRNVCGEPGTSIRAEL